MWLCDDTIFLLLRYGRMWVWRHYQAFATLSSAILHRRFIEAFEITNGYVWRALSISRNFEAKGSQCIRNCDCPCLRGAKLCNSAFMLWAKAYLFYSFESSTVEPSQPRTVVLGVWYSWAPNPQELRPDRNILRFEVWWWMAEIARILRPVPSPTLPTGVHTTAFSKLSQATVNILRLAIAPYNVWSTTQQTCFVCRTAQHPLNTLSVKRGHEVGPNSESHLFDRGSRGVPLCTMWPVDFPSFFLNCLCTLARFRP